MCVVDCSAVTAKQIALEESSDAHETAFCIFKMQFAASRTSLSFCRYALLRNNKHTTIKIRVRKKWRLTRHSENQPRSQVV